MKKYRFFSDERPKTTNLYYKLNIIFALFFLFPVLGFIFLGYRYQILTDQYVAFYFIGVLLFSLVGFVILKKLFDKITDISETISKKISSQLDENSLKDGTDELQNIVESFSTIQRQFKSTFSQLEKKSSEISILKELTELCYVTFDTEEILHVTLERALMITNSNMGSVLILNKRGRKSFTVKASAGLGEFIKLGDRIDFDSSIAKYAVLNKSPLLVTDVEKDRRFGRSNLPQYGTKSFVCMPIKTSKDIIGVLNLSSKDSSKIYSQEDVDALTPLLSNAAFTYENLKLLKENEAVWVQLRSIEKIFKIINSSFRDSELLQAVLNEIRSVVPFQIALVLTRSKHRLDSMTVFDLMTSGPSNLAKGGKYPFKNTIIEKMFKQEATIILDRPMINAILKKKTGETASNAIEKEMLYVSGRQTCLLTPLRTDGVVTGVLAMAGNDPDMFHDVQNLIEWIANGLSIAIERNRLSAAVFQRNQELETIKQIGSALASSTFDINKVLKYTMNMTRTLMNAEAGSIMFLNGKELELAVAFNTRVKTIKKFKLRLGQGIAGHVAARGESLLVNDTQKSPHFFPGVDEYTEFETRSALCVPMISQGSVIGVIEVLNKTIGDFTSNDEDLLHSIATSVSIAIENSRLYKETVSMAEHERDMRRMFQKFVPKQVLENIIHGEETGKAFVNEIKTVTLLNIDIRGFTEIAFEIGPQRTVSLLNSFFSVMGDIVFKHNGIVDKYLGDGFLALFGAPVSSIKDAENAIKAALEMKRSIKSVNQRALKEMGISLNIGISVHTGDVVVGNIGFEKKMDYTVIGDAVNTVFRLQELTRSYPNGIIIGENTVRAAQSKLDIRDLCNALGELRLFELVGIADQTPAEPLAN